jgi:hypothetical protein
LKESPWRPKFKKYRKLPSHYFHGQTTAKKDVLAYKLSPVQTLKDDITLTVKQIKIIFILENFVDFKIT